MLSTPFSKGRGPYSVARPLPHAPLDLNQRAARWLGRRGLLRICGGGQARLSPFPPSWAHPFHYPGSIPSPVDYPATLFPSPGADSG
jgi:hypothetical protein